jgi:molecular chaperone HtpG
MKLLRFESSFTEKGKSTSLTDYVSRMGADQKDIYYLIGANRDSIESGPYLEGLKARNLEVLFCFESVDEYVMNNVRTFDGKNLTSADRSDLELSEIVKPDGEEALSGDDLSALATWLKESLGDRVEDVKASTRLVDSPVVALSADAFMTPQMRRMMKAMDPEADAPAVKVHLEINPSHPLIRRLATTRTEAPEKAKLVAEQLLDNALISAGLLEDPTRMLSRIYKLLEQV